MSDEAAWLAESIEHVLASLRDVDRARVTMAGDVPAEIHLLTSSTRPARQIVRDAVIIILMVFHLFVDVRIISVDQIDEAGGHDGNNGN